MTFETITLRGFSLTVSQKTTWFMVELTLDEVVGHGEATIIGSEAEMTGLIANLCDDVARTMVTGLPDLKARVLQSDPTLARRGLASALEQAWLSALAKRANTPLHGVLGGAVRNKIPFYANVNRGISDRRPEGFATRAKWALDAFGAAGVKIAPFDGLSAGRAPLAKTHDLIADGVARIAAVRDAIGPDPFLLVDCHSRFSAFKAMELIRQVEEFNLFWLEDLCPTEHLGHEQARALRRLANDKGMRVAGGENAWDIQSLLRLIDKEGHDVVLPDLRYTGIAQGLAMLRLAEGHGLELSLHNPVGPVFDAVSTHVAAALPSFLILERQLGETPLYNQIVEVGMASANGEISVSNAAGLGIDLRTELLEQVVASASDRALTRSFSALPGAGPDA